MAFDVAPGVLFAPWTRRTGHAVSSAPRTSKLGLMSTGPASTVDKTFTSWVSQCVHIATEPHGDVFGHTFAATNPDGNLIPVSPVD